MDKHDIRQSRQIGGLKTQNKFLRQDIAGLKFYTLALAVIICVLGVAVLAMAL